MLKVSDFEVNDRVRFLRLKRGELFITLPDFVSFEKSPYRYIGNDVDEAKVPELTAIIHCLEMEAERVEDADEHRPIWTSLSGNIDHVTLLVLPNDERGVLLALYSTESCFICVNQYGYIKWLPINNILITRRPHHDELTQFVMVAKDNMVSQCP